MTKGQSPSIDAIRIELGNTGSKTTIHRYLKEIEETEGTRLDDEALLSNTLKEMIARLAATLREEASEIVTVMEEKQENVIQDWQAKGQQQRFALETSKAEIEKLRCELCDAKEKLESAEIIKQQNQRLEQ